MSKTHSEFVPLPPTPSPLIQATVLLVSWLDFQPPIFLALPNNFFCFSAKMTFKNSHWVLSVVFHYSQATWVPRSEGIRVSPTLPVFTQHWEPCHPPHTGNACKQWLSQVWELWGNLQATGLINGNSRSVWGRRQEKLSLNHWNPNLDKQLSRSDQFL